MFHMQLEEKASIMEAPEETGDGIRAGALGQAEAPQSHTYNLHRYASHSKYLYKQMINMLYLGNSRNNHC